MCLPVSGLVYLTYSPLWLYVCRDALPTVPQPYSESAEAPRRLVIGFQSFAEIGECTKIGFHWRLLPSWGVFHTVGNPAYFLQLGSSTPICLHICKYFQVESHSETQESHSQPRRGFHQSCLCLSLCSKWHHTILKTDFQGWCLGLCRVPCASCSCCLLFREEPGLLEVWINSVLLSN